MASLSREYRRQLERVIIEARQVGEKGAKNALKALAVEHHESLGGSSKAQRDLRNRLRAHGRQLGDRLDPKRGTQTTTHLASECAYEHWHRMLFARFLAENNLLIEPESGVALSLDDCRELAHEKNTDWLELASSFATRMLPQIFRSGDPVLEVSLPPETRKKLEELLESLPREVFASDDSLGWVYQFWQTEQKKRVNDSGEKIGADELSAVTQLFTEDYMVLFLLHNTLGAWWTAKRKAEGKDAALPGYEWTYLRLKEDGSPAGGSFDGWPKLARDVKVLDPSMGSGHFLTFAFPILVGFRMEEEGLSREDAVYTVLRDNLFGMELDNRCTQIAAFNLALVAWRMIDGFCELPQLNLACSGLGINAKEDEWLKLAGADARLRDTMASLFALFQQAPILGSLIDPTRVGGPLFAANFDQVEPLLLKAISKERGDDPLYEMAVAARGVVAATRTLAQQFTLVVTNVPYLGRGKMADLLREYCDTFHSRARADLSTCFVERSIKFCAPGGTITLVTPQAWLALRTYKALREHLLKNLEWNVAARIGPGGFDAISGEVVNVALTCLSRVTSTSQHEVSVIDCVDVSGAAAKAEKLRTGKMAQVCQSAQARNPDSRITFHDGAGAGVQRLSNYASSHTGLQTGDNDRYSFLFWELPAITDDWEFFHRTAEKTATFTGRIRILRWEKGRGSLVEQPGSAVRGLDCVGKSGVLVHRMSRLPVTLYTGEIFDQNGAVILPAKASDLLAIWGYLKSPQYHDDVRKLDRKLGVTPATLVQVPFDQAHWNTEATLTYSNDIPASESADPTQWLHTGQPLNSEQSLHVAVARLVGYCWPRQTGSRFMDCPALGLDGLEKHTDDDGIVCQSSIQGKASAADRLRALLADAHGKEWSGAKLAELLSQVGYAGKSLEEWLRDSFFEQHCELFHHRPFVWHIWDGLRDGFHALVNYHKLSAANGEGRQTLEKLIYTYLGDWIDRQRADQKNGVEGADARVAAAVHLQAELKKIVGGGPPYDIFVRWKPLGEQPIGWEPDINDGVRLNIRPFMTAKALNGRGKGTSILRVLPKGIKWEKDRGKESHRTKDDFPWFWSWDESTEDFAGDREFDGNRWNDLHYSIHAKKEARSKNKVQSRKGAGK